MQFSRLLTSISFAASSSCRRREKYSGIYDSGDTMTALPAGSETVTAPLLAQSSATWQRSR